MKIKAAVVWVVKNEPVLLTGTVTTLVATGLIDSAQASAVSQAVTSIVMVAVGLGGTFAARSRVSPTKP